MKIGIDARFLTHPQLGGFKTYTVNLTRALSQIDHDNEYIFYVDCPPMEEHALPQSENFTYQVVPSNLPVIGMPYREQVLLKRQIDRDKPDIVHFLCNTAPVPVPMNFVLSLLDVIQIKSQQNFSTAKGLAKYKRWAINNYSRWTILNSVHSAEKIITLSNYEKDEIVTHLDVAPERVSVTYFGVNPVFFEASFQERKAWREEVRHKYGLRGRFIMGVGYEPRKNIPLLIKAFAKLAPNNLDLDLVIVSAEKHRSLFFQQMAAELNLDNRIIVLDSLPPSELAILYNLADVFVFPSERESFGAPPLEALACGTPTIAMNMTSLPEVLEDGAILIDGTDVQTWANAIEQILMDDNLRSDLIMRGLQQAAKLTWQRCAQETIQIYQAVGEKTSAKN